MSDDGAAGVVSVKTSEPFRTTKPSAVSYPFASISLYLRNSTSCWDFLILGFSKTVMPRADERAKTSPRKISQSARSDSERLGAVGVFPFRRLQRFASPAV